MESSHNDQTVSLANLLISVLKEDTSLDTVLQKASDPPIFRSILYYMGSALASHQIEIGVPPTFHCCLRF